MMLTAVLCPSRRTDTQAEIHLVCQMAKECGASDAVPCHHWAQGGRGSLELARAVEEAASKPSNFQFLYNLEVRAGSGDHQALRSHCELKQRSSAGLS